MVTRTHKTIRTLGEVLGQPSGIQETLKVENSHRQLIGQGVVYKDGRCTVFICMPAYGMTVKFKCLHDMLEHMNELSFRTGKIDYRPTLLRYERKGSKNVSSK